MKFLILIVFSLSVSFLNAQKGDLKFIENKGQLLNSEGNPADEILFYADEGNIRYIIRKTGVSYLTLNVLKHFGWDIENNNYKEFHFNPKVTKVSPIERDFDGAISYTVEGDWSGAAFLLVAGAISGKINVEGLDINSAQADKEILSALTASRKRRLDRPQKKAAQQSPNVYPLF